jgi:hypothetical protein
MLYFFWVYNFDSGAANIIVLEFSGYTLRDFTPSLIPGLHPGQRYIALSGLCIKKP